LSHFQVRSTKAALEVAPNLSNYRPIAEKVVHYQKDNEMDHSDDYKPSGDCHRSGETANGQRKGPKKIATVAKAVRAITTIVVFGIPLVTGTVTLLGYGIYEAYKRMISRS
jgi:hypothetical protein